VESDAVDEVDRKLMHALQLDARAPFNQIAAALDVSDQTVARRFRRLRSAGVLRVVGLPDGQRLGHERWMIRLRCTPDAAGPVAEALARRADTAWVSLLSGGTEIACAMQPRSPQDRDTLLLQKLPRTSRVTSVSAHSALHYFVGGPIGWPGLTTALTDRELARFGPAAQVDAPDAGGEPVRLDERDEVLLRELAKDGRIGYPELAAATGWSESTVKRRMEYLRRTGAIFFEVEINPRLLGYQVEARLWMSVPPSQLAAVGNALAGHPEVAFAGAITGSTNLHAIVLCRDAAALYDYLTTRLGALTAIQHVETALVIRHIKRAGSLLEA
jgi:DNA-binding Lrp family transcriptional regulator